MPNYNLNVTTEPLGTQYGTVTGSGVYANGSSIVIQSFPNSKNGYQFKEWSGDILTLVDPITANPNTVTMPSQDTNITSVFRLGSETPLEPFWVNSGYTIIDLYSLTIVEKFLTDPDDNSFIAKLSNPNSFPIYVNLVPSNNYGIAFGSTQYNAGINANSTLGVQGVWSDYYDYTSVELSTFLTVTVSNPTNISTIFYYKIVTPASCYVSSTPYSAVDNLTKVTTQSYSYQDTTNLFTIYNPSSSSVVLKVKNTNGSAATLGSVKWYDESNNLLNNNSRITIGSKQNYSITIDTDANSPGGLNSITLIGINSIITSDVWIADPFYIATIDQTQSSSWFQTYAVWPTCSTFINQQVNNTILLYFEGGSYTFEAAAQGVLTIDIDGVSILTTTPDSYKNVTPDSTTVTVASGTHYITFNCTNNNGLAGIGATITGPGLTWTSSASALVCPAPVPSNVERYLIFDAPYSV